MREDWTSWRIESVSQWEVVVAVEIDLSVRLMKLNGLWSLVYSYRWTFKLFAVDNNAVFLRTDDESIIE